MPPETTPLALDAILTAGATITGRPVVRAVLTLDDGRRVAVDLPRGASATEELTPTQQKIVMVLTASPVPLTRKAVASKLGHKASRGRLAQGFQSLLETGRIVHRHGEYADAEDKFDD